MKNVVITGILEGDLKSKDGSDANSADQQKSKYLLARMENHSFDDQIGELDIFSRKSRLQFYIWVMIFKEYFWRHSTIEQE